MDESRIKELEAEVTGLREEIAGLRERERDMQETRSAMLYMLEDLNESSAMIEKAKAEWEATFDSIEDPIFIHDSSFRVIRCNKAYSEASGLGFAGILGRPYYEVFPRIEGPFEGCARITRQDQDSPDHAENIYQSGEKVFRIKFYAAKVKDGKTGFFVHLMEDVTEARRAEIKIRQEMEINRRLLAIASATAHTTDMGTLMEHVVDSLREIVRCDVCLAYTVDQQTKTLQPSRSSGLPHDNSPFFNAGGFELCRPLREAFEKGEPVLMTLRDMEGHCGGGGGQRPPGPSSSTLWWMPPFSSVTVVPLSGKGGRIGLLLCFYTGASGSEPLTPRDMEVLKGISHQVSVAMEEARLYKESIDKGMELSRNVQTIKIMNEIDRTILSTLEPRDILETATHMVSRLIMCDRSQVALIDADRGGFVYTAGFGVSFMKKGDFFKFADTNATEVIKTGRPQYFPDVRDLKEPPLFETRLAEEGFSSVIRVPLIVRGEVAGLLGIGSRRPAAFTSEDLSIIEKLAAQIGVALENSRLLSDLEQLFIGTIKTLAEAIDAKSHWTRGHSERVTAIAMAIGTSMGLGKEELKKLEMAGLLHDIGKLGTYEAILDKGSELTDEEFKLIRMHPQKGVEILSPIRQMREILPAIKYHHESYDGRGYPEGLKGEDIPFLARILTVADTVDAMSSDRPYRKGKSADEIAAELKRFSGIQFDPTVVEAFMNTLKDGQIEL